jgi:hypothetical protein
VNQGIHSNQINKNQNTLLEKRNGSEVAKEISKNH